jgi:hypothetical protein
MHLSSKSESQRLSSTTGRDNFWSTVGSLTLVCALTATVIACVGYARSGGAGILAALIAAAICWVGAAISQLIAACFRATPHAASGVLLGSPIRMGIALVACLVFMRRGGALLDAGIVVMILVNYLVTLFTDTYLLLRVRDLSTGSKRVSRAS